MEVDKTWATCQKWFFIFLGLALTFLAFVCLVSWVSETNLQTERYKELQSMWVVIDPPCMSLYLSVPGFFTSAVAAIVSFCHAD